MDVRISIDIKVGGDLLEKASAIQIKPLDEMPEVLDGFVVGD
jgi:hypothetical protein